MTEIREFTNNAGQPLVTEACERGLCGNCFKGRDQEWGWCECNCHPLPRESRVGRGWRRFRRRRLLRSGDLGDLRKLADKRDPDYVRAMAQAFQEVLGEDL